MVGVHVVFVFPGIIYSHCCRGLVSQLRSFYFFNLRALHHLDFSVPGPCSTLFHVVVWFITKIVV